SIRDLDSFFARRIKDPAERRKFVIAAYNSGMGHVADAIALAQKYGKNPSIWFGNVEEAILWKSNPDFYNDEVCRFGYFRGRQTVAYVKKVLHQYSLLSR
ncbi:MAG: lytic transglycosylase F, partial [Muribaculaceae bacterium]